MIGYIYILDPRRYTHQYFPYTQAHTLPQQVLLLNILNYEINHKVKEWEFQIKQWGFTYGENLPIISEPPLSYS